MSTELNSQMTGEGGLTPEGKFLWIFDGAAAATSDSAASPAASAPATPAAAPATSAAAPASAAPTSAAPFAPATAEAKFAWRFPQSSQPAAPARRAAPKPAASGRFEWDFPQGSTDAGSKAGAAASPAPKPGAPKPGAPKPFAPRPGAPKPGVSVPPINNPAAVAAAEAFGEIGPSGEIFVLEEGAKRQVGTVQSPTATPSENMSIYVQRYLVLEGKVKAFEAQLTDGELPPREADKAIAKLEKDLAEPPVIGNLAALRDTVAQLKEAAATKRAELDAARAAAKATALAERTALVEKAEALVGGDLSKINWKSTGEELRKLLEEWKTAQRSGVRIDRGKEDELWKRFSAARSTFDRGRRQFFSELDEANAAIKAKKALIVKDAEKLADSTDWAATGAAYRGLMDKWKAAGRAGRKDDDALWAQFRAAQDKFFAARDAANKATDAELEANLTAKKAILVDAETILPVKNLAAAKSALRGIQDRWEAVGKVPRAQMNAVEGRLKAVEQAVRDAEQAQLDRTNPEKRARAEGAAAQLLKTIDGLEADLAKAQAAGNAKKVAELESSLAARRAWLEQIERAASEHR